ncbi:toll/interleukin-1 receptor domain-containing protein [uncultured Bradyrhizobium sp.]|uniref:toll/interleukin-1 receptor domain-containing protein n=1 Tax=Bradyrhizobium sp. TaxID=376 RepID=UPI00261731A3|nr:toll/interleukin-1 receptor domain-containing protein [uncultured Bradyrhizobium sp.]
MAKPKKIFISYNHKDQNKAVRVLNRLEELEPHYTIWFDRHVIEPGRRLADQILEGLNGANYYVILISENSNKSQWVKRELSTAFDLSKKKDLALVPFMIDDAETPLEFRGQLTINARGKEFESGLDELVDFFKRQNEPGSRILYDLKPGAPAPKLPCEDELGSLDLGDLRFLLTKRLTVQDVGVLWFDLFTQTMENEVAPTTLAQYCVTLIAKSQREELLLKLYKLLCRNHPRLAELAKLQ